LGVVKPLVREVSCHPQVLTGEMKPLLGCAATLVLLLRPPFLLWLNTNNKLSEGRTKMGTTLAGILALGLKVADLKPTGLGAALLVVLAGPTHH